MQNEFSTTLQTWFGIQPNLIDEITAYFKPLHLKKEDFFLRTDQYANRMAFLQSGILREYFTDDKGREITKWIATPGYFITDIASFLFQQPARCHWQALTDCELLTISKDDYRRIGKHIPEWAELEKLFMAKCFTMLESRIVAHLSLTSEERYQLFFNQSPQLFNQVPLQYIASLLGMTPETFSRIRKKQPHRIS
ncbi:MAG: Crp/Fnr family transcriptional regulator [Saprospiraceae bacterium]|nr:Crp/Fnr family transcriptional regulator [Saprospiraceae bacterium]